MTKEKLQERLGRLREQLVQTQNNANALYGAIQEAEFWLAQMEEPDGTSTAN